MSCLTNQWLSCFRLPSRVPARPLAPNAHCYFFNSLSRYATTHWTVAGLVERGALVEDDILQDDFHRHVFQIIAFIARDLVESQSFIELDRPLLKSVIRLQAHGLITLCARDGK